MAHKKAGGSSRNGRDSESKRLGVKVYGGQAINAGGIIIGLLFFLMSIAIVVLLARGNAAQFYAAHRARRSG